MVYGRSPWGTIIELISYPDGIRYPQESEAFRPTLLNDARRRYLRK
ncbi:hypothetical protein [Paenibacillus kribbensis]|nr:hypothetical protein [Paenibacillus kribbensis]